MEISEEAELCHEVGFGGIFDKQHIPGGFWLYFVAQVLGLELRLSFLYECS
jgi:hypothetical protein